MKLTGDEMGVLWVEWVASVVLSPWCKYGFLQIRWGGGAARLMGCMGVMDMI